MGVVGRASPHDQDCVRGKDGESKEYKSYWSDGRRSSFRGGSKISGIVFTAGDVVMVVVGSVFDVPTC